MAFMFDKFRRSLAAGVGVKYERDSGDWGHNSAESKLHWESLTNADLVTPTPDGRLSTGAYYESISNWT